MVLLHIQNRWVISFLFIVISLLVVLGLTIYKNEKTVDLSDVEINHLKLNETFDNSEYSLNKHVKLDRYVFYNHNKYKNLTIKVKKKHHKIKGIILVKDTFVNTNFDVHIGDQIDAVIDKLGYNYDKDKVGKGYDALVYLDKDHHMKLTILYKDNIVKRIEFFSR